MEIDAEELLCDDDLFQWYDLVAYEQAQVKLQLAVKDAKIWCIVKNRVQANWAIDRLRKALKTHFNMLHNLHQ